VTTHISLHFLGSSRQLLSLKRSSFPPAGRCPTICPFCCGRLKLPAHIGLLLFFLLVNRLTAKFLIHIELTIRIAELLVGNTGFEIKGDITAFRMP